MDKSIGRKIHCLSKLFRRTVDNSTLFSENNWLTGMQGWVLGFVSRSNKEVFQRDLEAAFNVGRSSMTEQLQNLECNGVIRREEVDYDARLKKITLTEKGKSLDREIRSAFDRVEKQAMRNFKDEEIDLLMNFLDRIKANLEEDKWLKS